MLVLGRFPDQQILIDGGIRITIVYVRGNKVGLGIEAPDGTTILRSELYDGSDIPQKLPRESKSSATTPPEIEVPPFPQGHTRHENGKRRDFGFDDIPLDEQIRIVAEGHERTRRKEARAR